MAFCFCAEVSELRSTPGGGSGEGVCANPVETAHARTRQRNSRMYPLSTVGPGFQPAAGLRSGACPTSAYTANRADGFAATARAKGETPGFSVPRPDSWDKQRFAFEANKFCPVRCGRRPSPAGSALRFSSTRSTVRCHSRERFSPDIHYRDRGPCDYSRRGDRSAWASGPPSGYLHQFRLHAVDSRPRELFQMFFSITGFRRVGSSLYPLHSRPVRPAPHY